MTTRGLVITPRFVVSGTSLTFPGSVGIEADDLRHYLLYWDRLDWPQNNLIHVADSSDTQFLRDAGILTRTDIAVRGSGSLQTGYVLAQLAAFEHLASKEPGRWALGQAATGLFDPRSHAPLHRVIEVELYSALPSPPPTVGLADVLTFRERRRAELLSLRQALDDIYLSVVSSADIPRAKDAAFARLEATLRDLTTAASERWTTRLLRSMKIELKLPEVAAMALIGSQAATTFQLPGVLGAGAGAAIAAIKFEATQLHGPALPPGLKDFAYIFHASRELK